MSTITEQEPGGASVVLAEQAIPASTPARSRVALQALLALLVALLAGALLAATLPQSTLHALQAAGAFKGTPIDGVQSFVDKLKGNIVWLGGTSMGLVIAVIGLMFAAGHSRAQDVAIRTLAGLMILASVGGIVA